MSAVGGGMLNSDPMDGCNTMLGTYISKSMCLQEMLTLGSFGSAAMAAEASAIAAPYSSLRV